MQVAAYTRVLPPPVRQIVRRQVVRYRSLGIRPQDAMLVSYPKSGSTWLRFLLAHALTGREADFDSIRDSIPPLGRHRQALAILPLGGRLIRSHEPLTPNLTGLGQRIVYLIRDGRDVALSYVAHQRRYQRYQGDIDTFLDLFLAGRVDSYGTWHDHVLGALALWQRGSNPFLLVRYEDLRANAAAELARVLAFLGWEGDPAGLAGVVAANNKDRMRAKEAVSEFLASQPTDGTPFVRHDRASGWEEEVPLAQRERFEAICGRALVVARYGAATQPVIPPGTGGRV